MFARNNGMIISTRLALSGAVLAASIYVAYYFDIMRSSVATRVLAALSLVGQGFSSPSQLRPRDLESYIAAEREVAYKGVLANIGANGARVAGAAAGIVVASPDKFDPDCRLDILISSVRN